jgi:hypothetical protein
MRFALTTGLVAVAAATAIAAPAHAQTAPVQAQASPAPTIQGGPCQVRRSGEGKGFTFATCLIGVDNAPQGQTITVDYKSNLKTYNPHAEFGPWNKTTGSIKLDDGEVRGVMFAFPNKSVAQVKKTFKLTLSTATPGVANAVATA